MSRSVLLLRTVASQQPFFVLSVGGWPEVDAEHGLELREGVYVGVGVSAQGAADGGVVDAGGTGECPEGESAFGHGLLNGVGNGVCGDGSDRCISSQGAVCEGHVGVRLVLGRWTAFTGGHGLSVAISLAVLAFSSESWDRGGYMHHGFEGGADQPAKHTHTPCEGAPLRAHPEGTQTWTTQSPFGAVSS